MARVWAFRSAHIPPWVEPSWLPSICSLYPMASSYNLAEKSTRLIARVSIIRLLRRQPFAYPFQIMRLLLGQSARSIEQTATNRVWFSGTMQSTSVERKRYLMPPPTDLKTREVKRERERERETHTHTHTHHVTLILYNAFSQTCASHQVTLTF